MCKCGNYPAVTYCWSAECTTAADKERAEMAAQAQIQDRRALHAQFMAAAIGTFRFEPASLVTQPGPHSGLMARWAAEIADAMLAEWEKRQP